MVVSVGRITAGSGYDYLTREVATSRHDYYTGRGEAPGQWAGRGAGLLGLAGEVDADDMAALYGRFVIPNTVGGTRLASGRWLPEQVLGRKVSARQRPDGTVAEPVAAFDLTFSPSKSVSLLWALTPDERVRAAVLEAHETAVAAGLAYLEDNAGHTRAGVAGIRKVPGDGLVIAQFRHRTARSTAPGERVGDPQLHSHCAILNRVRGHDGVWRTLDSRAVYRHAHAAGALYAAILERELTRRLGVSWDEPAERVPMREITGTPARLIAQFSTRRAAVLASYELLEDEWRRVHGRSPTRDERATMMDTATLRTRQPKTRGDVNLHEQWRANVDAADLTAISELVTGGVVSDGGRLLAGSVELRERVFAELHEQRAWWTRAHITAEVARLVAEPTPEAIELEAERTVALCVPLEPDGDPEYSDLAAAKYTSPTIQDAEQRVLNAAATEPAEFAVTPVRDPELGDDQVHAMTEITAGGGRIATVVGPAGAGKTTMLRSVAASCAAAGREVVVLTLSAAAARVVTDETGLDAHTIASWRVGAIDMPRDGLVIVDEASMVPTLVLDEMVRVAGVYRSKMTLLGDFAQMAAPEAGGLLRDLASLPSAVELTTVRRFANRWERGASKRLRARTPSITALYERHGRIIESRTETVFDSAANAWWDDTQAGAASLVVTDTTADAAEVSTRCQHHLMVAGRLGAHVANAADGCRIHIRDQIQTRRNTNEITTSDHHRVLNRDVWTVTAQLADGSLAVAHASRPASAVLPADYVAENTVLAYATTIAGAQGRTVDRGHVVVTPRTNSAGLYVGMSRGKLSNHAHVVCDSHDHTEFELGDLTPAAAFAAAITRDPDAVLSATTIRKRWKAAAAERQAARTQDRHRRHVTEWWQQRQLRLPTPVQVALAEHHGQVLDALIQFDNDDRRERAVTTAVRRTDWRASRPSDRFTARLRTLRGGTASHQPEGSRSEVTPPVGR